MSMEISSVIRNNREIHQQLFDGDEELKLISEELKEAAGLQKEREHHPLIATGHQPTIYYPGLLFKNFFAGDIARQTNGTALNFVVDTDRASFSIPLPFEEHDEYEKTHAELKNPKNEIYAGFHPSTKEVYNFFASTDKALDPLSNKSIPGAFNQYKKEFLQLYEKQQNLTETLSVLRNRFDSSFGHQIRDIKISQLAQTKGYNRYILYLIKHIERFNEIYNRAVEQGKNKDYQPVKSLNHENGWYELPFWLAKNSKRYPVHVKKDTEALHFLSQEADTQLSVSIKNRNEDEIIENLRDTLVLYPKATTLTSMIRLFLCDAFIHGTGAMEYEKINDKVLNQFFPITKKPVFYTVTGDIWLPLVPHEVDGIHPEKDYKRKQQWLKEVNRDPERYLSEDLARQYKQKKKDLAWQLKREEDPGKRNEIHNQLTGVNQEMLQHLMPEIERVKEVLNRYDKLLKKKEVFFERKYPYFIYPPAYLTAEAFRKNIQFHRK